MTKSDLSQIINQRIIEWNDYPLPNMPVDRAIEFLEQIKPKIEELEEMITYIKEKDIGT